MNINIDIDMNVIKYICYTIILKIFQWIYLPDFISKNLI